MSDENLTNWPEEVYLSKNFYIDSLNQYTGNLNDGDEKLWSLGPFPQYSLQGKYIRADLAPKMSALSDEEILSIAFDIDIGFSSTGEYLDIDEEKVLRLVRMLEVKIKGVT